MKLINRWVLAAEAATLIKAQGVHFRKRDLLAQRLEELGPNPHPDAVDKVEAEVQNMIPGYRGSLTRVPDCDECKSKGLDAVMLLSEKGADETVARCIYVCANCLLKALVMIEP